MTRNRSIVRAGITFALLTAALTGCAGTVKTAAPPQRSATLSGKITETMDAGGYTYLYLEKDGEKTWVAAPAMKVTVGQEIELLPGAEMTHFASTSLNRTFDRIIFSGGVVPAAGSAGAQAARSNLSLEPVTAGKVIETINAATYTYILLEKDGRSSWSAVPITQLAVGDEIELQPGTPMGTFVSKTLNRTFDAIYFSSGVKEPAGKKTAATADTASGAAPAPALPPGHPALSAAAGSPPAAGQPLRPITGKVVETMNSGGYTYICLEKEGVQTWAAVPPLKVKVGDDLTLNPGYPMTNFTSKGLNRTFTTIIFSGGPASH